MIYSNYVNTAVSSLFLCYFIGNPFYSLFLLLLGVLWGTNCRSGCIQTSILLMFQETHETLTELLFIKMYQIHIASVSTLNNYSLTALIFVMIK